MTSGSTAVHSVLGHQDLTIQIPTKRKDGQTIARAAPLVVQVVERVPRIHRPDLSPLCLQRLQRHPQGLLALAGASQSTPDTCNDSPAPQSNH